MSVVTNLLQYLLLLHVHSGSVMNIKVTHLFLWGLEEVIAANFYRPYIVRNLFYSIYEISTSSPDITLNRSSRSQIFFEININNFAKFTENICATLLKKRLWHRRFPVNFAKFLTTLFFIEHLWWQLLTQWKPFFKHG